MKSAVYTLSRYQLVGWLLTVVVAYRHSAYTHTHSHIGALISHVLNNSDLLFQQQYKFQKKYFNNKTVCT